MEGTHEVGRRPFMPDSTLSRRSAALMGAWTRPPLLPKTHKFHTETAGEPNFTLWSRERTALDRRNEIHKLRGCRHRTSGDAQPADELALCSHGATEYIRSPGSGRDRLGHRNRTTVRISARLRYS